MVATALGGDQIEPPATGCWCCGDRTVQASLLRLDEDDPPPSARSRDKADDIDRP